jgi:predicted MPP superfamily phosphohydrolase
MDHNPASIGEYGLGADLILCGHTHKGQLFPASIVTNAMYDVDYGYYRKDAVSPHVIVSSGVGYWGMPMRVGTDCEIVSVKIKGE